MTRTFIPNRHEDGSSSTFIEFMAELDAAMIPPRDFVLTCVSLEEVPRDQWSRTILFDADRSLLTNVVPEAGLLGAIEKHRYFRWRTQRHAESGTGFYGRFDFGKRIPGANVLFFGHPSYGMISVPDCTNLVCVVAKYLAVCDE